MTTTTPAPAAPEQAHSSTPNVYHLHGRGTQITYYPDGAGPLTTDGAVTLVYQDTHTTKTFRAKEVSTDDVAGLGTAVTVILQTTVDVGSTTATLLIPSVVLAGAQSVPVHTVLITTVHSSPFSGIGHPQRDVYTTTGLQGSASAVFLPL